MSLLEYFRLAAVDFLVEVDVSIGDEQMVTSRDIPESVIVNHLYHQVSDQRQSNLTQYLIDELRKRISDHWSIDVFKIQYLPVANSLDGACRFIVFWKDPDQDQTLVYTQECLGRCFFARDHRTVIHFFTKYVPRLYLTMELFDFCPSNGQTPKLKL